jgi:hypothetical protein
MEIIFLKEIKEKEIEVKMKVEEINFTEKQKEILRKIHNLAREMEQINNQGKAHAVIALIEEFSKEDYISPRYIKEKMNLLFDGEAYFSLSKT